MSNPVARRDKHVKLQVRINITDEEGSRACPMNTGKISLRSGPARASDGGDIVVPEKGRLSEAGRNSLLSGLASSSVGVLPCISLAGCRGKLLQ